MGCYGIGLPRLMGTIVEIHNDKNGIIWPEAVAPFQVHLISLGKNKEAEKIYTDLQKKNIEVLYDDRQDTSTDEKFADADLIGIPTRVVVSEKSIQKKGYELKKRNENTVRILGKKEILECIKAD